MAANSWSLTIQVAEVVPLIHVNGSAFVLTHNLITPPVPGVQLSLAVVEVICWLASEVGGVILHAGQSVMFVVHAPPADGQQYSAPPQTSTLPAESHKLI